MKAPVCTLVFVVVLGFLPSFAQQTNLASLQARAAKGDAEAEVELGVVYQLGGKGVPKDYAKAADLYRQAAAQGNAHAMYNLGYIYHHGQGMAIDDATALPWFQKAADLGWPAAQLQLGLAYYFGDLGLKQDYAAADKWLTLAAQQKNAPAQSGPAANALGSLYEHGWGVPLDGAKAAFWYGQGAEMGYAKARGNLGRIDQEGLLVKKDPVQGYMWLKLAASQHDPMATHMLSEDLAGKTFTPEQIAEGDRRVADYQAKHHAAAIKSVPMVVEPETMGPGPIKVLNAPSPVPVVGPGSVER